ncbi:MAG: hypothetical protein LPL29_15005 [Alphaproteobacteria bacterium]|nr:hypothetical protein [Alphaproteobacteria bacterium]
MLSAAAFIIAFFAFFGGEFAVFMWSLIAGFALGYLSKVADDIIEVIEIKAIMRRERS